MEGLKPPAGLDLLHGNLSENWRRFRQRFELYLTAAGGASKSATVQSSLFLHVAGEEAVEVYNTFTYEADDDKHKLPIILDKFEEYCNPKKNTTYERYKFFTCVQGDMSISQYITELKLKAKSCEFGQLQDSLIRDRVVCGITSDTMRERLLREMDITLEKAMQLCLASETSKAQIKQMHDEDNSAQACASENKHVDAVKHKQTRKNDQHNKEKASMFDCKRCGVEHAARNCPAYGKQCKNCEKMNHFAKMCRSRKVHAVDDDVTDQRESLFVGVVNAKAQTQTDEWTVDLKLEHKHVKFKLDTGAQANVIPYSLQQRIGKKNILRPTDVKLSTYTGDKIHVKGKCNWTVKYKKKTFVLEFIVVKKDSKPILGIQACEQMGLIKRVMALNKGDKMDIFKEYADVFEGIGCLEGEHTIQIDASVTPKVHPPRKVPVTLREKLRTELNRMEKMKVITKIEEPTQWVNPIVIVEKPNGKLRICLDPRDLNTAVMREHYQLPTVEEITSRLTKAKYFTVLDASSGFWQLKLDEASSRLCTFNTPFGRYRFLRLAFGINSAPEVFHRTKLEEFRKETKNDVTLTKLTETVLNGWPETKSQAAKEIQVYWNFREEISVVDGILFKGERLIVPAAMRMEMLQRIHESHLGIENCRRRAREVLFWPGMSQSISETVNSCDVCCTYQKRQTKEPLHPHSVPERPWQKIGVDLFTFDQQEYLLIVDYYSKFIEVEWLKLPMTSQMLTPQMVTDTVQTMLETRQNKQKEYFDQGSKALQKLQVGENVRLWQDGVWNTAQVTGLSDQPRSYVVETPDGQVYRRNRKFLMQSKEQRNTPKEMDNQHVTQQNVCDSTEDKHEMDTQNKTTTRDVSPTELPGLPGRTASGRMISKPRRLVEE
ncbi:hypothetical protein N1851_032926 [Merluccius polli]|uniref:Gypsy retrotransposon integrase-like protein 1 n=1 Tax=Merluccius polli TaxID=89951 RepID=A0AA47M280_MERPO|nr:hypothetical protein N1851_032926 [Merluccius polli]